MFLKEFWMLEVKHPYLGLFEAFDQL